MAGFEHGEKLVCLTKVKVNDKTFQAGEAFPYIDLNIDPALVDSLMSQRKIARAAHVSQQMIEELRVERTEKLIKNFPDGRVAVSWPDDEPLPEGVIDGRPSALKAAEQPLPAPEDDPNYDPDLSEEEPETEPEEETANTDSGKASSVEIVPADGTGWFNVVVDGITVNTKKLRKRDAILLKKEYV